VQRKQNWRDVESPRKKSLYVTNGRDDIVGAYITMLSIYTYITRRLLDTLRLYLHITCVACVSLGQDGGGNK